MVADAGSGVMRSFTRRSAHHSGRFLTRGEEGSGWPGSPILNTIPMCAAPSMAGLSPASAETWKGVGFLISLSLGPRRTCYLSCGPEVGCIVLLVGQVEHCWSVASAGHEGGMRGLLPVVHCQASSPVGRMKSSTGIVLGFSSKGCLQAPLGVEGCICLRRCPG
jgi:hypothetical protein